MITLFRSQGHEDRVDAHEKTTLERSEDERQGPVRSEIRTYCHFIGSAQLLNNALESFLAWSPFLRGLFQNLKNILSIRWTNGEREREGKILIASDHRRTHLFSLGIAKPKSNMAQVCLVLLNRSSLSQKRIFKTSITTSAMSFAKDSCKELKFHPKLR